MSAPSAISHRIDTRSGPCPCGCAPCEPSCCGLECLVRPHYFCGQLLTDTDLTALVDWSRARFALSRYRDGWGVVSGLTVTLDPDDRTGTAVRIGEGYAVDCCGNDIVVCESFTEVLRSACPTDDCADPWAEPQVPSGKSKKSTDDGQSGEVSLVEHMLAMARPVDLFLHYREEGSEPQATLHRGACGHGDCENSRVREGYSVDWKPVGDRSADGVARAWEDRYRKRRSDAREFAEKVEKTVLAAAEKGDYRPVRDLLESWVRDHPTGRRYAFAYDWIRHFSNDAYEGWPRRVPEIVFWLILDDLESWLTCDRHECDRTSGVGLARIWLLGPDAVNRRQCRIVAIDDRPPHRRPLGRDDCLPARAGCVNLGRYVGQRWDVVCAELTALGIGLEERETSAPSEWDDLTRDDAWGVIMCCGATVKVRIADPGGDWGARVVGFAEAGAQRS